MLWKAGHMARVVSSQLLEEQDPALLRFQSQIPLHGLAGTKVPGASGPLPAGAGLWLSIIRLL